MYTGATEAVIPTPNPPMMRATIKKLKAVAVSEASQGKPAGFRRKSGGNIEPMAEIVRKQAASSRVFFRPMRSEKTPAIRQPTMVPSSADDAAQPRPAALSRNWACKNVLQPEIMAVS
jgi:hypothetical protein